MKKIRVISCLMTVAVMALIFFFSSQTADSSSEVSGGVLKAVADICVSVLNISETKVAGSEDMIHFIVRKTAHFTVFAALGACMAAALRTNTKLRGIRLFAATVCFCMFYAVRDELHQLLSDGRSCRVTDVIIDTCGSAAGCGCSFALFALCARIYGKKSAGCGKRR